MGEVTKLILFMLGVICICMATTVSTWCLIPAVIFWASAYLVYWFTDDQFEAYDPFDLCDPANGLCDPEMGEY